MNDEDSPAGSPETNSCSRSVNPYFKRAVYFEIKQERFKFAADPVMTNGSTIEASLGLHATEDDMKMSKDSWGRYVTVHYYQTKWGIQDIDLARMDLELKEEERVRIIFDDVDRDSTEFSTFCYDMFSNIARLHCVNKENCDDMVLCGNHFTDDLLNKLQESVWRNFQYVMKTKERVIRRRVQFYSAHFTTLFKAEQNDWRNNKSSRLQTLSLTVVLPLVITLPTLFSGSVGNKV
jgi:hypothetical protein